jgi:5'-3' exonuclease
VIELQQKQEDLTEEELNKLAAEKMKDIVKKLIDENSKKKAEKYVDRVQLGEDGWKLRYYKHKFHVGQEDLSEFLAIIKQ